MIPVTKDLTAYIGVTFGPYIFVFNTTRSRTIGTIVDVDAGTDKLTCSVNHELDDGDQVRFTTTGVLPSPLSEGIYYYARDTVPGGPTTLEVSLTSGGASIDLTDEGTGIHTILQRGIPLDLTGWSVRAWAKHEMPCDDSVFLDLAPTIADAPNGRVQLVQPDETTLLWKNNDLVYSIILKNTGNEWLGPFVVGKLAIRNSPTNSGSPPA